MTENKGKRNPPVTDASSESVYGAPETAFEAVYRFGTYEIQATSDTENEYPAIAQGFNKKIIKTDREKSKIAGKK